MSSKRSLLWLQAFVAVARSDTLQDAAARAGLSTSTLSSHLRNLENHLGASLFDHSKRLLALCVSAASLKLTGTQIKLPRVFLMPGGIGSFAGAVTGQCECKCTQK